MPDLEDEGYQHEVVKEVHGNQKFNDAGNYTKFVVDDPEDTRVEGDAQMYHAGLRLVTESCGMECEVHVVDKKVVDDDGEGSRSEERWGSAGRSKGFQGVFDVLKEIEIQFGRASESGNEIAKMLEAGKLPDRRKHHV